MASSVLSSFIVIAGVGGAGCKAVAELRLPSSERASCLLVDTDEISLKRFQAQHSVLLGGGKLAPGLDGPSPKWVRDCFREQENVFKALLRHTRHLIIVAGLGGIVGGELSPLLFEFATNDGIKTYGVFALPLACEASSRRYRTENALDAIRRSRQPHLCYPFESEWKSLATQMTIPTYLTYLQQRIQLGATVWLDLISELYLESNLFDA